MSSTKITSLATITKWMKLRRRQLWVSRLKSSSGSSCFSSSYRSSKKCIGRTFAATSRTIPSTISLKRSNKGISLTSLQISSNNRTRGQPLALSSRTRRLSRVRKKSEICGMPCESWRTCMGRRRSTPMRAACHKMTTLIRIRRALMSWPSKVLSCHPLAPPVVIERRQHIWSASKTIRSSTHMCRVRAKLSNLPHNPIRSTIRETSWTTQPENACRKLLRRAVRRIKNSLRKRVKV